MTKAAGAAAKRAAASPTKKVAKPGASTTKPTAKKTTTRTPTPSHDSAFAKPKARPTPRERAAEGDLPYRRGMIAINKLRTRKGNPLTNDQRRLLAKLADGLTPMEFAASVLRDEGAPDSARRWATEVLMPYMHQRLPMALDIDMTAKIRSGVLVAPAQITQEEWLAKYGATPPDVVDVEAHEVQLGPVDGGKA